MQRGSVEGEACGLRGWWPMPSGTEGVLRTGLTLKRK